jgi:serine/threonine protein kinase
VVQVTYVVISHCCTFYFLAAFLDAKNGMVNLVVEYMDGGSLQDLVDRGGCQDEQVLADITHQVSCFSICWFDVVHIVLLHYLYCLVVITF